MRRRPCLCDGAAAGGGERPFGLVLFILIFFSRRLLSTGEDRSLFLFLYVLLLFSFCFCIPLLRLVDLANLTYLVR